MIYFIMLVNIISLIILTLSYCVNSLDMRIKLTKTSVTLSSIAFILCLVWFWSKYYA